MTPAPDELPPSTRTQAFTFVSARTRGRWRLSDGTATIAATLSDEHFKDEILVKGDVLQCEVRAFQTYGHDGLSTEYVVLRVLEHRRRLAVVG